MTKKDRYSLWPEVGLPPVRLRVLPDATVDRDGWVFPGPTRSLAVDQGRVDCPSELHLREFGGVDVTSADDLVDLVRVAGFPLDALDLGTGDERPWIGVVPTVVKPSIAKSLYRRMIRELANDLGQAAPDLDARPGQAVHLVEIGFRVLLVQLLVAHLREVLAGNAAAPVWQAAGMLDPVTDHDEVLWPELEKATAEQVAWSRFSDLLSRGLASVSPRVSAPMPDEPRNDDISDSFTAACTLMFNDLIDGVPYRQCKDETCGRWFKYQLGRSTGKHSRTDAVYCTPQHARNQAQRVKRRDKRADQQRNHHGE